MVQVESLRELEHDALYQEVSALLALADACMHRVPASQASAQLLREGFKCPMSMYKAAKRDLQVLKSKQHLHIPVRPDAATTHEQSTEEAADYIGDNKNLLGVSSKLLQAVNGCQMDPAEGRYVDLMVEVEARLLARREWLAHILLCPEADNLAEEANSLSRNLEATQQQGLSGLLGLAEDVKAYLQLLSSFLDQQNRFVKDQKLTKEKELDYQENCALAAACNTQVLKVQAMERRLLEQTYTATSLPALSAVAHHLEVAEAEAEAKHLQLSTKLRQYEELGPEFEGLTTRYHQLLEDLRHAEFTLQEFQQAEASAICSP